MKFQLQHSLVFPLRRKTFFVSEIQSISHRIYFVTVFHYRCSKLPKNDVRHRSTETENGTNNNLKATTICDRIERTKLIRK